LLGRPVLGRAGRRASRGGGLGRGDQRLEQPQVVAFLGVPLDPDAEGVPPQFDCLGDLIVRPGDRDQALADPLHGLVVQGRHPGLGTEPLAHRAARIEVNLVRGHLVRIRRVPVVAHRVREMLDERAAPGHVEDVHAAADREERQLRVDGRADERHLEPVPAAVRLVRFLVRDGVVQRGVDVGAAGEHDAVEAFSQPVHAVGRDRGENDRRSAGAFDGPGIGQRREDGLANPIAPVRGLELTGNPNERAGHAPSCGVV